MCFRILVTPLATQNFFFRCPPQKKPSPSHHTLFPRQGGFCSSQRKDCGKPPPQKPISFPGRLLRQKNSGRPPLVGAWGGPVRKRGTCSTVGGRGAFSGGGGTFSLRCDTKKPDEKKKEKTCFLCMGWGAYFDIGGARFGGGGVLYPLGYSPSGPFLFFFLFGNGYVRGGWIVLKSKFDMKEEEKMGG